MILDSRDRDKLNTLSSWPHHKCLIRSVVAPASASYHQHQRYEVPGPPHTGAAAAHLTYVICEMTHASLFALFFFATRLHI